MRSGTIATVRGLYQDIALRAVHGTIVQEQDEQSSVVVSSNQIRMRGILALAEHAVAVVRDQIDGRTVARNERKEVLWK